MRPRSTPRLTIAALLFVVGLAVYVPASGAPRRVHLVFILGQALFLPSISYVAWALAASLRKRLLLLLLVVAMLAPLSAYASSLVIRKVEFHPIYVLMDFVGLTLEGALFLGLTWGCDRTLSLVRTIAQRRAGR